VVLLRLLPAEALANPAVLVLLFVLTNLQITAFYFAATLVLLERGQGVLAMLLVSPLSADQPRAFLKARDSLRRAGDAAREETTPQDSSRVPDAATATREHSRRQATTSDG